MLPQTEWMSWSLTHFHLPPKQFFEQYHAAIQPTSQGLCHLLEWMCEECHSKCPNPLKLHLWKNLKSLPILPLLDLSEKIKGICKQLEIDAWASEEASYENYIYSKKGLNIIAKETSEVKTSAPLDLPKLWKAHFKDLSFEDTCLQIFGHLPSAKQSFIDTLVFMLNNAVFYLALYGKKEWNPIGVKDFAASLVAGFYLTQTKAVQKDETIKKRINAVSNVGSRIALERIKEIQEKFSKSHFSAAQIKGKTSHAERSRKLLPLLPALCGFLKEVFLNPEWIKPLSKPWSGVVCSSSSEINRTFHPLQVAEFLFSARSLAGILEVRYSSIESLKKIFKNYGDALKIIEADLTKMGGGNFTLAVAKHCLETLMKTDRMLELNLFETFANVPPGSKFPIWFFYDTPLRDMEAILFTLRSPLTWIELGILHGLDQASKTEINQCQKLLPDCIDFVANLTCLYEKRVEISRWLDFLRMECSKVAERKKGRPLQETLDNYLNHPNVIRFAHLITWLKPCRDAESVKTGEMLKALLYSKLAFPDYLEKLIEDSFSDAEECMSTMITLWEKLEKLREKKPHDKEIKEETESFLQSVNDTIGTTRDILEATVWLKAYFAKQLPLWESEISGSSEKCKPAEVKKKKKKKKKKKPPAAEAPPVEKESEPEKIATPVPQAQPPKESPAVRRTQEWKEKVALMRKIRDLTRNLKKRGTPQEQQEMEAASQTILSGGLRRLCHDDLAALRKEKVAEIKLRLHQDGWEEIKPMKGDHHKYKHPCLGGLIVIPFSSESQQLKPGTFNSIAKIAGWMET